MSEAWKANIESLVTPAPRSTVPPLPWVAFAAESIDAWVAEQLSDFVPSFNFVEIRDVGRTDQRVSALFERVMTRRNELLGLQSSAYTRALQYRAGIEMRQHLRTATAATDGSAASIELADGIEAARDAFAQSPDSLAKGHTLSSSAVAASVRITAGHQAAGSTATSEMLKISERVEDELQVMQTLERGPFDYEGRYLRIKKLYLNDFKSLVSGVQNYLQALTYIGDPSLSGPEIAPEFNSPTYIWEIGPLLQSLSSALYAYRSRRIYRTITMRVGFPGMLGVQRPFDVLADIDWQQWQRSLNAGEFAHFSVDLSLDHFKHRLLNNPRLEAFGIQWLDNFLDVAQLNNPERNFTVQCGVQLPDTGIPGRPSVFLHFENSPTSLTAESSVQIEDEDDIRGLKAYGKWRFFVGNFHIRGRPVSRIAPGADSSPKYPAIYGMLLHMRVCVDENVTPPALPPPL